MLWPDAASVRQPLSWLRHTGRLGAALFRWQPALGNATCNWLTELAWLWHGVW